MNDDHLLADLVIRGCVAKHSRLGMMADRPVGDIQSAMLRARRFVLDDPMSSFLADLATAIRTTSNYDETLASMRHSAMLPHPVTWVEFNGQAFRRRLNKTGWSKGLTGEETMPGETSPRIGLLLEQHPRVPTAVRMTEFMMTDVEWSTDAEAVGMPFSHCWNAADAPLPWPNLCHHSGMLGHGILGNVSPFIGTMMPKNPKPKHTVEIIDREGHNFVTHMLVPETAGSSRYAMAFLAALNDLPANHTKMSPTGKWYGRGSYRKFLDHTVISLNLPASKDTVKVARRLITNIHRRAHECRGHWRLYERKADLECSHVWSAIGDDNRSRCGCCPSWRTWIAEHQRGDASVGFVTHSYSVGHKVPA